MNVKTVLSHLSGRQVEVFYALLVASGKYTFLPELYDIFGRESAIRFLEVFAGCRIRVPTIKRLEELARATEIYVRVEKATPNQRVGIVKVLAEEYEVTEDRIRTIFAKTKVLLEDKLGFTLIRRSNRL